MRNKTMTEQAEKTDENHREKAIFLRSLVVLGGYVALVALIVLVEFLMYDDDKEISKSIYNNVEHFLDDQPEMYDAINQAYADQKITIGEYKELESLYEGMVKKNRFKRPE